MKIRTKLLLSLLPTLIIGITLVSTFLAYNWHREIVSGFKTKLKTSLVTTAAILSDAREIPREELEIELTPLQVELGMSKLYLLPLDSQKLAHIPHKGPLILPIHKDENKRRSMTGYAPIFDRFGQMVAVVAGDMDVALIDQKFREALFLICLFSGVTIFSMIVIVIWIANKISRPVQKLGGASLAIAAGKYDQPVSIKGPKEIVELAGTLSTMRECLIDTINRLKENSLVKERLSGEYECSKLLQHLMLEKNIENCKSDAIAIQSITLFSETPKGFLLDFPLTREESLLPIHLAEAKDEGFEGMYELLMEYKLGKMEERFSSLLFCREKSLLSCQGSHVPLVWSLEKNGFLPLETNCPVESGDYFFLFNEGFFRFHKRNLQITMRFLEKVLSAFATQGLEVLTKMLKKELAFQAKRKEIQEDLHLLAFQILNL